LEKKNQRTKKKHAIAEFKACVLRIDC